MPYIYTRIVRFGDTDAAGVVYFANVLAICHEAYEASLAASSIDLKAFFSQGLLVIPIVHASIDFMRPMFCGDRLLIGISPQQLSDYEFAISYKIFANDINDIENTVDAEQMRSRQVLSKATTRHVCVDPVARSKQALPSEIKTWLQYWQPA
jgi:1,4-dihydroxy-2-naphthoyl-CoA hydrolase